MLTIKTLLFVGYLAILILDVTKKADSAAKSALTLPHATVGVFFITFKHCISQYILSTWQCGWNDVVANKLHSVTTVLGDWLSSYRRKLFCVVPATVILI